MSKKKMSLNKLFHNIFGSSLNKSRKTRKTRKSRKTRRMKKRSMRGG
jgi:hypothetical protein